MARGSMSIRNSSHISIVVEIPILSNFLGIDNTHKKPMNHFRTNSTTIAIWNFQLVIFTQCRLSGTSVLQNVHCPNKNCT